MWSNILRTWPRLFLRLPFTIQLLICALCFLACTALYYYTLPFTHTGYILAIPMLLASWTFNKYGAFCIFTCNIIALVLYNTLIYQQWTVTPTYIYSLIGSIVVLLIEGYLMCTLRSMLDTTEEAQRSEEEARTQAHEANERLRQLNQLKNQFIINVNHELRTPLTAAYGYLEMLYQLLQQTGYLTRELHAVYLKNSLNYCDELQRLVNHVLDTMAIANTRGEIATENLQLYRIIREVMIQFATLYQCHNRLHLDISPHVFARGNAHCIRHVLYNLLSNAHKYSPSRSPILVCAYMDGEKVRITVSDKGAGIPVQEQTLLFDQFVRLPQNLAGPIRGTGLGLYISKHLVEAMQGDIWVESRGIPGQGSNFHFTLPTIAQTRLSRTPAPNTPIPATTPSYNIGASL
ncbi:sensor histidine kinase [Ktedonospora formicarum]|uniref:histidine kinase n=1 Tax=Ktedonospora formicarum TaxID=2778364 RepID=A0A8J3MQF0_9CHLR|nr:HAMP domain-containing sensor histidine kinase [Ktedonospora formicarum]GHO43915.1 hypothetical protein KSX_20780 [Ktedonospora formicarum]